MHKTLKIIIDILEWLGIIFVLLVWIWLIGEGPTSVESTPEIIKEICFWAMYLSVIFILVFPLWLLKDFPMIFRIQILFNPGLVVFFWSAFLVMKGVVLAGIDLRYLSELCAVGSLAVAIVLKITYAIRRKRMEEAVGKRNNKVSRTM